MTKLPTNRFETDDLRICVPIYVGVSHNVAKRALEILRDKCVDESETTGSNSFISVQHNTTTSKQHALERRLRVDLHTLRGLLFDSMSRGLNLDLALRIQQEVQDELTFITKKDLQAATKQALVHYDYFVQNDASTLQSSQN